MTVTIEEKIRRKIDLIKKWEAANPGWTWENSGYAENQPKIYIARDLLDSPAFRSLSAKSIIAYLDFLSKRDMRPAGRRDGQKWWACANNGSIQYPYSEAVDMGFSRRSFRDAIDELQLKGLMDITHLGKGGV